MFPTFTGMIGLLVALLPMEVMNNDMTAAHVLENNPGEEGAW